MSQTYPYSPNEWERSTIKKCRSNHVARIKKHAEAFEEKKWEEKAKFVALPFTYNDREWSLIRFQIFAYCEH